MTVDGWRHRGLLVLAMAWLGGCASRPTVAPPPEPGAVTVSIDAATDVNPDRDGRPSPIQVWLFVLDSGEAFSRADYFTLSDGLHAPLGSAYLARHMVTLAPGEHGELSLARSASAHVLGVIAGYQAIDSAQWKDTVAWTQVTEGIEIHLQRQTITWRRRGHQPLTEIPTHEP